MGVSLPAISPSVSDDNINLGDKDSIRRRALWTLEGKTDVGTFSKVEIPELDTAGAAKKPFDLRMSPALVVILKDTDLDFSYQAVLPSRPRSKLWRRSEFPHGQQARLVR